MAKQSTGRLWWTRPAVGLALITVLCTAARAQVEDAGRISGVVRDWAGEPIAGAVIQISAGETASTRSGDDGRFGIEGLLPGRYTLTVADEGLAASERVVQVRAGAVTEVEFQLRPLKQTVDRIEVTAGYSINRTEPIPDLALTREEIRQLPNFGNDMFRALQYLPGVAGNDVSAQFNVRGGLFRDNMVRVNGLEVYEPFHLKDFQGVFSIVDPEMIGTVDMINGGFPSEYGDRMASVVDLTTAPPSGERQFNLGVSISSFWGSGSGNFASDRGRWLASARRGYLDIVIGIAGPEEEEDESRSGSGPRYWDLLGRIDYQLTPSQSLAVNALAASDSLEEEEFEIEDGIPTREQADTSYGNANLWINHQAALGSSLLVETLGSAGRIDRDRRVAEDGFLRFLIRDERDTDVFTLRQEWSYLRGARHYLKWGFEARGYDSRYDYLNISDSAVPGGSDDGPVAGESTRVEETVSGEQYSIYVADRVQLTDAFTLELGARYDEQTWTDDSQVSPRVNLVWDAGPGGFVRAAWGYFFQSQRPHELQVEDGETEFQLAERAEHYLLGWERGFRLWGQSLRVRIDGYYRRVTDARVRYENLFVPFEPNPEVRSDRIRLDPESSEARGFELFVTGRGGGKLDWWMNYALSEVTDRLEGRDTPRNIDQRHALNLNLNYRMGPKWNFNFAWIFHSGWPTTAVSAEAVELPDGSLVAVPVIGPIYDENLTDYHRLDIRASRYFELSRRGSIELFIDVQNLYDRRNLAGFEVDERNFVVLPGGEAAYVPNPEYWFGVLPSAGVSWRF